MFITIIVFCSAIPSIYFMYYKKYLRILNEKNTYFLFLFQLGFSTGIFIINNSLILTIIIIFDCLIVSYLKIVVRNHFSSSLLFYIGRSICFISYSRFNYSYLTEILIILVIQKFISDHIEYVKNLKQSNIFLTNQLENLKIALCKFDIKFNNINKENNLQEEYHLVDIINFIKEIDLEKKSEKETSQLENYEILIKHYLFDMVLYNKFVPLEIEKKANCQEEVI